MGRKPQQWELLLEDLREEFVLREKQLELLHEIDLRLLRYDRRLDKTFKFITDRTRSLIGSDHASILLRRGRFLETTYSSDGLDIGQQLPIEGTIAGTCLTDRKVINIPDVSASEYKDRYYPIAGYTGPEMRSLLETPIEMHDDSVGVLCVESTSVSAFTEVHAQIMEAIAAQVAIALQRVQHFDREKLFAKLDRMVFEPTGSQQVIQLALTHIMDEIQRLGIELSGAQILFRKDSNELEIVHSTNPADIGLSVSIDESICGRAVKESRTIVVGDVSKDKKYRRMLGSAIQSEIAIPLTLGDENYMIGVLNVESEELDAFSGYYQIILDSFADKVRILLAFAKLRADVTEALEVRQANDLLIAIGDQATNMIHRLNSTAGALRFKLLDLREMSDEGKLQSGKELSDALDDLVDLASQTLEIPEEVTLFLSESNKVVDINQIIAIALSKIKRPANITVLEELQPDIPMVSLYSFEIVVQNLIKNAVDAMPDGGTLTISTGLISHTELLSGYVQITISDTGAGIAQNILPHIFELNFTTKRSKGRGLGFGLWWVRKCILRSGGDISVASGLGRGSIFTIKIPVELSDRPELRGHNT
jgi:signal transduction histidine kinase